MSDWFRRESRKRETETRNLDAIGYQNPIDYSTAQHSTGKGREAAGMD